MFDTVNKSSFYMVVQNADGPSKFVGIAWQHHYGKQAKATVGEKSSKPSGVHFLVKQSRF